MREQQRGNETKIKTCKKRCYRLFKKKSKGERHIKHYNIEHQREKVIFDKLLPFLNNFIHTSTTLTNCIFLEK